VAIIAVVERQEKEMNIHVTSRQFVRILKLVDDTLRSRLNRCQIVRRQIRRSAVKPSSKVLFHIYTRNETFDSFDNFPEEICRASRAFCYDPAHTYVTALATLLKRPHSPLGSRGTCFALLRHPRDTNHARTDPSCSQERRIRPSSFMRFQRPRLRASTELY